MVTSSPSDHELTRHMQNAERFARQYLGVTAGGNPAMGDPTGARARAEAEIAELQRAGHRVHLDFSDPQNLIKPDDLYAQVQPGRSQLSSPGNRPPAIPARASEPPKPNTVPTLPQPVAAPVAPPTPEPQTRTPLDQAFRNVGEPSRDELQFIKLAEAERDAKPSNGILGFGKTDGHSAEYTQLAQKLREQGSPLVTQNRFGQPLKPGEAPLITHVADEMHRQHTKPDYNNLIPGSKPSDYARVALAAEGLGITPQTLSERDSGKGQDAQVAAKNLNPNVQMQIQDAAAKFTGNSSKDHELVPPQAHRNVTAQAKASAMTV